MPRRSRPIDFCDGAGELGLEDVLLPLREVVDLAERLLEVGGDDILRGVREPVRQQEGEVLREVGVAEDQEELDAVLETLDRVREPRGRARRSR
jgi:hypothetical protein